jgi:hypothetical protein
MLSTRALCLGPPWGCLAAMPSSPCLSAWGSGSQLDLLVRYNLYGPAAGVRPYSSSHAGTHRGGAIVAAGSSAAFSQPFLQNCRVLLISRRGGSKWGKGSGGGGGGV